MPRGRKKVKKQPVVFDQNPQKVVKALIGLGIILVILGLFFALINRQKNSVTPVSTKEILGENTISHQRIIISGEVNSVFAKNMFTIGGGDFVDEQEVLVISREEIPNITGREQHTLMNGDLVTIEGEAVRLEAEKIQEGIGFEIDTNLIQEFVNKKIIIAHSVGVTPRNNEKTRPVIAEPITDSLFIISYPRQNLLASHTAELSTIQVLEPVTDTLFWMGTSETQRMLGKTEAKNDLTKGQQISVSGTVELLPIVNDMVVTWSIPSAQYSSVRKEHIYIKINAVTSVVDSSEQFFFQ